jgi:hypothetical protein
VSNLAFDSDRLRSNGAQLYNESVSGTAISLHQIPTEYARVVAGIFDNQVIANL